MDCHHRAVHLSLFVLIVAVVFVSVTLVAGDSHHRALGVLAFLLIVARPVIALVTRRPARLKGGPEV